MRAFDYSRPAEVLGAIRAGGKPFAFLAGGTTLLDLVKLDVMKPSEVVDINRLPLAEITESQGGGMRVGALVRNSTLAWDPRIRGRYPVLAEAILSGASGQIRNMATTAGNLMQRTRCPYFRDNVSACNKRDPGSGCAALDGYNRSHAVLGGSDHCVATHPSDMCVALIALEAEVEVTGPDGERTIAIGDFHLLPGNSPEKEHALNPGELITAVTLPAPARNSRSWYLKLRDRQSYEFALASVAAVLTFESGRILDARIALGGVGTKPWRARESEAELRGTGADDGALRRAADAAIAGARPLKHNAFKVELARRAVIRTLRTIVQGQPQVRTI